MSWSASGTTSVANATAAISDLVENPSSTTPEQVAQVAAAKAAAISIVQSGCIVNSSGSVAVCILGHANPGHTEQPGYAYDTVTVTITQQPVSNQDN